MNSTPRVNAIVDLVSKVQRPWVFRVTVTGLPPHEWSREYTIEVPDLSANLMTAEEAAANKGIELFVAECSPIPGAGTIAARARRVG